MLCGKLRRRAASHATHPRARESDEPPWYLTLVPLQVRAAWGVPGAPSPGAWQGIMRAYYAACLLPVGEARRMQVRGGVAVCVGQGWMQVHVVVGSGGKWLWLTHTHTHLNQQEEHGPPAIAGELFTRPADEEGSEGSEGVGGAQQGQEQGGGVEESPATRGRRGAAAAAAVEYPAGGYWALPPATRVRWV